MFRGGASNTLLRTCPRNDDRVTKTVEKKQEKGEKSKSGNEEKKVGKNGCSRAVQRTHVTKQE
jgi:hypothetical protein